MGPLLDRKEANDLGKQREVVKEAKDGTSESVAWYIERRLHAIGFKED